MSGGWVLIGADDDDRGTLRDIGGRAEGILYGGRIYTGTEPEMAEYMEATMYGDELSEAIDGCEGIEPDGTCEHGAPSWERYWGVI